MAQKTSPTIVLLVLVVVFVVAMIVGQYQSPPEVPLPAPFPDAKVVGWLNTSQPLTAAALQGKWVVVDAWAPWCGPCMASMPELVEFRRRWPGDQVMVVGIADNSGVSSVHAAIDGVPGFTWPVAYGGGAAQRALGVEGLPTLILFDPAGKEVARAVGMGNKEMSSIEALEKIIADSGQ